MSNNTYNAVQTPAGLLAEDAEAPYSEGVVFLIVRYEPAYSYGLAVARARSLPAAEAIASALNAVGSEI